MGNSIYYENDYVPNSINSFYLSLHSLPRAKRRAPFKVPFNIELMRRPDLIGKLVDGSVSCAFGNSFENWNEKIQRETMIIWNIFWRKKYFIE